MCLLCWLFSIVFYVLGTFGKIENKELQTRHLFITMDKPLKNWNRLLKIVGKIT